MGDLHHARGGLLRPYEAIRTKVRDEIASVGVSVMHVFGAQKGEIGYSYTMGNSLRGLPEVIVSGIAPRTAQMLLATCRGRMDKGWTPTPGTHEGIFK